MENQKKSWLRTHLNEFVAPQLKMTVENLPPLGYFLPEEKTVIKNLWRSVKEASKGKLLILPGRDVFIFEVLARRENFPTLFLPACSRQTVFAFKGKIPENSFIFDTGFLGSIPRALGVKDFKLASFAMRDSMTQVFPHLSLSRHLALKIEGTPKYWQTGRLVDGEIIQDFSDADEFERAARLTIEIYKDSSPSFVNKRKPLQIGEIGGYSQLWQTKSWTDFF